MPAACAAAPLAVMLLVALPAAAAPKTTGSPVQLAIERVERQRQKAGVDAAVVKVPLDQARRALARAAGARESGDGHHAPLLERLATQWAELAGATVRAAQAESRAEVFTRRARQLRTKLERARALLTELQARHGRLEAEVRKAEGAAAARRQSAAAAESRRLGRGTGSQGTRGAEGTQGTKRPPRSSDMPASARGNRPRVGGKKKPGGER